MTRSEQLPIDCMYQYEAAAFLGISEKEFVRHFRDGLPVPKNSPLRYYLTEDLLDIGSDEKTYLKDVQAECVKMARLEHRKDELRLGAEAYWETWERWVRATASGACPEEDPACAEALTPPEQGGEEGIGICVPYEARTKIIARMEAALNSARTRARDIQGSAETMSTGYTGAAEQGVHIAQLAKAILDDVADRASLLKTLLDDTLTQLELL